MSVSKHKRSSSKVSVREKEKAEDTNIIYEHVRRIDGQEVVRKYVKCGLLGKGGFANCFVTQNIQTKRRSATKIVMKEELKSHRTRLRLANEIRLHKTLHHPNVVEFEHCFEDKQNVFIFLELCQNQSLNELIRIRNNFITPEIQSFMFGIVNGVKYIHSQRIIHRDLKLGNIFIDGKFNVKIGDFGLATKLEFSRQCKRTICGTPNYIAPEVLEGKGYHYGVDIWSIGVILYTFYYGVPPFETEDANTTYQRIKDCNYVIPKSLNVPHEAISLITKILVRNPADRPTLEDILQSEFMKLGQGILKELPPVCSRKAPTRKELTCTGTVQLDCLPKAQPITEQNKKEFIIEFQQLLEDTYYYKLANQNSGILEKDVRVLQKGADGKYWLKSLTNSYEEDASDCDLKYLLMGRERRFNIMDTIPGSSANSKIFLRKVQRLDSCSTLLRLSNGTIQFLLDDSNYILYPGGKLIELLVNNKHKEISIGKLLSGSAGLKGNKEHLSTLRLVLQEMESRREGSKENRA